MAKKHSDEGNGSVMGGEYTCEAGKWQYAESHLSTLKIDNDQGTVKLVQKDLSDTRPAINEDGSKGDGYRTAANYNGWRYWSRRVMPLMQEGQSAEEYARELERFDACDTLIFPKQTYVVNPEAQKPKVLNVSGTLQKKYKLLVDTKGNAITGEQFVKLMIESALKLALQRDLHGVLVARATKELRSEMGINEPVAGSRPTRAPRANAPAPEVDANEGAE